MFASPQVQGRTTLPRYLGSKSARFFGFVAFSRRPTFSSRHQGVIRTVLEARLCVVMLVEAGQSLPEKVARQFRRLGYVHTR